MTGGRTGGRTGGQTVTVRRVPASVAGPVTEDDDTYGHLAVGEAEKDRYLAESASVVLAERPAPTTVGALRWISDTLGRFPGCLLAATATATAGGDSRTVLVGVRDGRVVAATVTGPARIPGRWRPSCTRCSAPLAPSPTSR